MDSWEDDVEPELPPVSAVPGVAAVANKWEGEDEDDEVKDNWEDEDDEKQQEERRPSEQGKKNRMKLLEEKIAEKERQKQAELEKRLKDQESELTPEQRMRMQQESDLKLALETTFGDSGGDSGGGQIDGLKLPNSKEEFEEFTEHLSKKLAPLAKSTEYPLFLENLTRNLCATMSSNDIKKIKMTLENLFLEKQKFEKGDKSKKNKGKAKAKLRLEGDNQIVNSDAFNDYDEFDDFM